MSISNMIVVKFVVIVLMVTALNSLEGRIIPQSAYSTDGGDGAIKVGTSGLADTRYAASDRNATATWNTTSFAMFSNGTMRFSMRLHYDSNNPPAAAIFNSTSHENQKMPATGELRYIGSAFFMRTFAIFVNRSLGAATHEPVTWIYPMVPHSTDNKTSTVTFRGTYQQPFHSSAGQVFEVFDIQLSWLRVFEDEAGARYYQWLQGNCSFTADSCPTQAVDLDTEYDSLSGSFHVFFPKPESFTSSTGLYEKFNYVLWVEQNVDSSKESTSAIPLAFGDRVYNATLTSLTGRLENVSVSYENRTISWTVPINVDPSGSPMVSFIHQHVAIPKALIETPIANASLTVNGIRTESHSATFVTDPYSLDDYTIYHILLLPNQLNGMNFDPQNQTAIVFNFQSASVIPEFDALIGMVSMVFAMSVSVIIFRFWLKVSLRHHSRLSLNRHTIIVFLIVVNLLKKPHRVSLDHFN